VQAMIEVACKGFLYIKPALYTYLLHPDPNSDTFSLHLHELMRMRQRQRRRHADKNRGGPIIH
jgi:hypothetical protein